MSYFGMVALFHYGVNTAFSETVKLEDMESSGKVSIPQRKNQASSQPNPMGMGIHDPRKEGAAPYRPPSFYSGGTDARPPSAFAVLVACTRQP